MAGTELTRSRPARWMLTGLLALAPLASTGALLNTAAAPTVNGILWCCVAPQKAKNGPKMPAAPQTLRLIAIAPSRLRRGRLRGQGIDSVGLRRSLLRRKQAMLSQWAGPARYVRAVTPQEFELPLLVGNLYDGTDLKKFEAAVLAVPGVRWARANMAGGFARVGWEQEALVDPQAVVAAAQAAGFSVRAYNPTDTEEPLAAQRRAWLLRLGVATFGAIATMFLAEPLYYETGQIGTQDAALLQLLRYLGMVLGTATAGFAAWPFFLRAAQGLAWRRVGMDALASVAVLATWAVSVYGFVVQGPVYFDSLTMFVALIVGARLFDGVLRERIMAAVSHHVGRVPDLARIVRGAALVEVPAEWLSPGHIIELRPGDRAPADGVIVRGRSTLDESMLTGEAVGILREPGATVHSGAVVLDGTLRVRVTRVGDDSTQGRLARLAEEAERPSGRAQRLADRLGHWGTLTILGVAVATGIFWSLVQPELAIPAAVAVLVITCPCALGLAIPAASAAAMASALRQGMLVKRAESLEDLARVAHVVFDKTGTLTQGEPAIVAMAGDVSQALRVAAELEAGSSHPLARAVARAAASEGLPVFTSPEDLLTEPGAGLAGTVTGEAARVGTALWLERGGYFLPEDLVAKAHRWMQQGRTVLWVGVGGRAIGVLAAEDSVREDASEVVAAVMQRGLAVSLLTGDHAGAAQRIAQKLGMARVTADVLPDGKCQVVTRLREQGGVAMVGDGLNDAPALAAADVGIALARGADLATLKADVVLVGDRLGAVNDLLALAVRTRRIVRENLFLAFLYNAIAVPLAVAGWVTPLVAAILMPASSLVVLLNTVRPRR
jgi:P-type Cu2+ transporter